MRCLGCLLAIALWAPSAAIPQSPDAPPELRLHDPAFDDDFAAKNTARAGDAIALQGGSLTSLASHAAPIEIEYEVKTDGYGVTLGYGADRIVFQSAPDRARLRIAGGPAVGGDVADGGRLAIDRYVTIRQTVSESALEIAVDGKVRAHWGGDFAHVDMPVSISNDEDTTLLVRSIRIRPAVSAAANAPSASSAPAPTMEDGVVPRSAAFEEDFVAVGATRVGGTLVTRGLVESTRVFEPPIAIEYRVKTDSTNVRLGFGADQIIFNWEMNLDELRVDGGPAANRHVPGQGRVPQNEFVTIRQVVKDDRMEIQVDGKRRAEWRGRFEDVKQTIRVFANDSTLTIASIHVKRLAR